MPSVRALLSYTPFFLGVLGCSRATTSAGSKATTRDALSTRASQAPLRPAPSSTPAAAASALAAPDSNTTLTDGALERKLDQLEREIRGS